MANLSKIRRDRMLSFLEELKSEQTDDAAIRAFNEIENHLRDKKYGLVWEEHEEETDVRLRNEIPILCEDLERSICRDNTAPWNFLIEGDNLQALYLLEKTHHGKVDCIYIDPPYNTGAKDWKYNNDYVDEHDVYRHSKWISFMAKRLIVAKKILKDKGFLIVTIDDNEFADLFLLIDEYFSEYKKTIITIQMNPGGTQGNKFSVTNEYAIVVYKKGSIICKKPHLGGDVYNLRRWGSTSNRYEGATCFYPIIINKDNKIIGFGELLDDNLHPAKQVEEKENGIRYLWPIDVKGIEKKWRYSRDTVENIKDRMFLQQSGERIEVLLKRETEPPKTVWVDDLYNSESHGTKLIKNIIGKDKFIYPKSLYAVKDCLTFAVLDNKDAIIVDFFAGSGTTGHAVNLLNAEDGGNRKCILVTNNEVSEKEAIALNEQGYQPGDPEWEKLGIAKNVTWPRILHSILGTNINGELLTGEYITNIQKIVERKRNVKQIILDGAALNFNTRKSIVSLIGRSKLPQSYVKRDSEYIIPEDYPTAILFNLESSKEFIDTLVNAPQITDIFIVTTQNSEYKKIKEKIIDVMGPIMIEENANIPMAKGFMANYKYFKCAWTPRRPSDYLLSNVLCLHIKEMIELQNSIELDNVKNVLILNKADYKNTLGNPEILHRIENVWVNQNIVWNSDELKVLKTIGFKYIPREFFGQELKEAAE